ncbi:MAG: LCP family protein [Clostridia bacterium]|nr:LCP family protein [Clostridia bacterium]
MNARKYIFIVSTAVSLFLFLSGMVILSFHGYLGNEGGIISDLLEPFRLEKEPVNILVLGGDKVASNTDTIILVNYNPATAGLNLLSIPRDTKVPVKGSSVPKINSAFPVGGEKLAVETVSKLFGVKIKYYVYIDTSSFRKIIDLLGGVDFYVPVDMDYDDPLQNLHIHLKKGQQRLDGAKAEQFMRFRQPNRYDDSLMKYYDGSDIKRIEAQQSFIREVIRQKANLYNFTKLNSIMSIVYKNIQTNIKMDDAIKLLRNIGKINSSNIIMLRVPGEDAHSSGGWYFIHDKAKTSEIIKQYFDSKSGFADNKNSNKQPQKSNAKPEGTKQQEPTASKTVPESTTPSEQSVQSGSKTQSNPSNEETSLESSNAP